LLRGYAKVICVELEAELIRSQNLLTASLIVICLLCYQPDTDAQ